MKYEKNNNAILLSLEYHTINDCLYYIRIAPFCIFPQRGQTTQLFHCGVTVRVLAPIGGKVSVRTEKGLFIKQIMIVLTSLLI